MFEWTQQRIEWYERAITWTGYDKALVCAIKPYIDNGDNVCDLGCGTGYLGLELARQGFTVSAVDISHEAMKSLQKYASSAPGIEMMISDWADISGRKWDNVIMCQTGNFETELLYYLSLCRKKLIVIGKSSSRRWRSEDTSYNNKKIDELSNIFKSGRLDFIFKKFSAELGQPFVSIEEAKEYLSSYSIQGEAYERALGMLEATGDPHYPYYLPYKKETGIWIINKV